MLHRTPLLSVTLSLVLLGACGDDGRRPLGSSCTEDAECESGLCYEQRCLDPEGDEDDDGLTNRLEASLGTRADNADTDGDGIADRDELGPNLEVIDSDGDGKPDILESMLADADGDCIPDQFDARDETPDDDMQFLVDRYCPAAGVCAADADARRVVCSNDVNIVACDLGAVDGFESGEETSCDGRDNDCDGATDEGLGPNGDGVCAAADPCLGDNGGCAGTCETVAGVVACGCAEGFALADDGTSCNDIDECANDNGGCAQDCVNDNGGFACTCGEGWSLDDDDAGCVDINECETGDNTCAQRCVNNDGGYTCECANGFALAEDGRGCDDVNECETANGGCAQLCVNEPGAFACGCGGGFVLNVDGLNCDDINECEFGNGGCSQVCNNNSGGYACGCNNGFALAADGRTCNDINDCAGVTCSGRGSCVDLVAGFRCECTSGYGGTLCETPVCVGGCGTGVCTAPGVCDCRGTGFAGNACETPVCEPGCDRGTCVAPNTCACDDGWAGPNCDGLLAFVSSTGLVGGDLGIGGTSFDAFAKAAAHCTNLAAEAGYEGDFVGWISTRGKAAAMQIPDAAGPWYRVDGVEVARDRLGWLVGSAGSLRNPLNLDERGNRFDGAVMTGTDRDGKVLTEKNCGEWQMRSATSRLGDPGAVDGTWTDARDGICSEALRIYCLQIPPKMRIFVTREAVPGNFGGVETADEICLSDAAAAGIGGTWKAWLSTSREAARDRMSQWPFGYRNMNGEVVATTFEGLLDRGIDAPLMWLADGSRRTSGTTATWTGTNTDGTSSGVTCNDWNATSGNGTVGLNTLIDVNWTAWGSRACSNASYLYCVEQ